MPKLTIFTPVYNRAYILHQLYQSLLRQTSHAFEWVVIDDGSSDGTSELLEKWRKEKKIPITFRQQENQGKHIAINSGVKLAQGELFFIVDSDDYLTDDAVQKILHFWASVRDDDSISGIMGYRIFSKKKLVGSMLPDSVKRCKLRDTALLYGAKGDKVVIYRTSLMKRFPYPQFEGEKFLGESYVFNQIDDEYDMAVMRDYVYIFAYQKDGLSQNFRKLYRDNPRGFLACFLQDIKYIRTRKEKVKTYAHILCLSLKVGGISLYVKQAFSLLGIISAVPALYLYMTIFILKRENVKPYTETQDI